MAKLRLNKILAQAGLGSRRRADGLIAEGHVAVNGVVTRNLATLADPDADRITVDGRPLPPPEARHYLLLNKPRGYVTTLSDPQGRPVVADLVDVGARLYPVGRLDWDVEGALLLTNDGALTHRLLHPRYGLPRVYEAEVEGRVAPGALARWRHAALHLRLVDARERSEEHTSELQSHSELVCRLLPEKKNARTKEPRP